MRQLTHELAAAHAPFERIHAASRKELLRGLATANRAAPLFAWRRVAFGGVGLSAAAALILLAIFANSATQLSAMERIVNAVRDVKSFSYELTQEVEQPPRKEKDKPARTLDGKTFTCWRAPADAGLDQFGDFRASQTHEWIYHLPTGDQGPELTMDLTEIHPSGKPGILIDYVAKKFYRVPPLHADDIANSKPLLWLRAVREKAGRLVEDLGARQIGGRNARGYVMTFDGAEPFDNFGPVEVWIDPQTDLPMEFSFEFDHANAEEGFPERFSVTDIQWNADLGPKLFDTSAPAGFLDVTMPTDENTIAEVIDALGLFADLSGGRYPHVEKLDHRQFATRFDADACYREMLDLAGFAGPERDEWASDLKYQRIQQSRAGLDTLERILQSYRWLIGYDSSIGPRDKDKVLLWWNVPTENPHDDDQYRVFYGDLRTEIVPEKTWVQFVPPEIAELQ
jgi:hypothetical protein